MEKRNVDVKITNPDGSIVFEQDGFEVPEFWSDRAATITCNKYAAANESSAIEIIDRVVNQITEWGKEQGYFKGGNGHNDIPLPETFSRKLRDILINQRASFNSPVWFNCGVKENHPQMSACFISGVEDNMEDILDHAKREGLIFKNGSGIGINISKLRAKGEPLSNKGQASGPISFMRGYDAFAGVIKSGGKCLPAWQKVYTNEGPIEVAKLVNQEHFYVISYDPPRKRYAIKKAVAWKQDQPKEVVRITTDKGTFDVTVDHPVKLNGKGSYRKAGELKKGDSLWQCSVDKPQNYLRVHLRDGMKGKSGLHRLIARDILDMPLDRVVHHKNGDFLDNRIENLEITTQSEHATGHGKRLASKKDHVFQKRRFPKPGDSNPMHKSSLFWQDEEKVSRLKEKHSQAMIESGRAVEMQALASQQRMINMAHKVINEGYDISTLDKYMKARRKSGHEPGKSITKMERIINKNFGTYENFYKEVRSQNHQVISIESLGIMDVYSVEVECPTEDDKTPNSGHNYVLWSSDELTGNGIVVSNTRRSAKLVCMNVDHPDIMEFIECKKAEEEKAKILIANGVKPEEAYATVDFQNANHSIRVSGEFMRAVFYDKSWTLVPRGGGEPKQIKAKDILRRAAEVAWETGDPGIQFHDRMNVDNPVPSLGPINSTNPCSEFSAVDNSSCNLASFNLIKYLNADTFDFDAFKDDIKVMITAMDILVDPAYYPTPEITEITRKTRPLGLGYANLGALLMVKGFPYDSADGRTYAAEITKFMTTAAYIQSIELAKRLGPFEAYKENAKVCQDIAERLSGEYSLASAIHEYGIRNSQLTLLAPTGTISFMMDCDTTGIEPLFALKSYKTLAGGGVMEIVPECVAQALRQVYIRRCSTNMPDFRDSDSILEAIAMLNPEEQAIFHTANEISWKGHIDMMAAVQPHLSGAISKTVNLPNDASVEDVEDAYVYAWHNNLKALAIYRDGSKSMQPLSTTKTEDKPKAEQIIEKIVQVPLRSKMTETRDSKTHKFDIQGFVGYLTVGLYPDGRPGELFIRTSKGGSTMDGLMDSFAKAISFALQHGVPLETLVDKFRDTRFDPSGWTVNKDVPVCSSVVDYIFKWLDKKFLQVDDPELFDDDEESGNSSPPAALNYDGSPCIYCGGITQRNGTCEVCISCGTTTGCG